MADVYQARHVDTGEAVALKLLAPIYGVGVLEQRFRREAVNAARLCHPGCVRVIEHGVDEDGTLFLAMELLSGRTLRRELDAAGRFAPGHALRVVTELLDALAHAHAAGVLHRDLKPENVMLTRSALAARLENPTGGGSPSPVRIRRGGRPPSVVLIDFGLSVLRDDSRLTATGMCMGSPSYLAPERLLERSYDERADLYATGVILYELLAGAPPFLGETPAEIARQHIEQQVPPLRACRPEIPASLAIIAHRALAKDPDDRFHSADDMLSALRALPPIRTAPYPAMAVPELSPSASESTIVLSSRSITIIRPMTPWRRAVRWFGRLFRPRRFATGEY